MKNIIITLLLGMLILPIYAQTPQAFSYQAVVRNDAGNVLADQSVSFQISILAGSPGGTSVYTETHATTTNEIGLVTLEIGNGAVVTGTFAEIDWGGDSYFLQIEIDETGGTNYQLMGTSQLLSVPYALHAGGGVHEIDDLKDGKTGGNSVFLGSGAGILDDGTDNNNVAVGDSALKANTSGFYNTAIGYKALGSNTIGLASTAIGEKALYHSESGGNNIAIGHAASYYLNSGLNNVAIGNYANNTNYGGSNNTIIGTGAGKGTSIHNSSGNVFLGHKAGYNEQGDNKLYIENTDTIAPLVYGDFEEDILAVNGRLGIGTTTPSYNLDIKSISADLASSLRLTSSDLSKYLRLSSGNETYDPAIYYSGGDALRFMRYEGGYSELMRITSDGKVGIGTSNPLGNLDIQGTDSARIYISPAGIANSLNTAIMFRSTFGGEEPDLGPRNIALIKAHFDGGAWETAALAFHVAGNDCMTDGDTDPCERMRITSDGKVGIGTENPAGILDIAGEYHFPSIDGSNGQVLQTDGNGTLSWVTNSGGGIIGINDLTDGKTAGNSVFLGAGAGANDDSTNNKNVAVGFEALKTNISGEGNVANGYYALQFNSSGLNNTAIGTSTLRMNTSGDYNTATGYMAANRNTTGNGNTVVGYKANFNNKTGSNNTIIGCEAGEGFEFWGNQSGSVYIGYQAGRSSVQSNRLFIENSDSNSPLIYGEFDNDLLCFNGNVGIHISEPLSALHVYGDIRLEKTGDDYLLGGETEGFGIYNAYHDRCDFIIDEWGNIGMGTTSPENKLDIRGNVTIRNRFTGAIVMELGTGLDYAEGFNVADNKNIEPGTILCIDPDNPGHLKISEAPYDKTVAGIVAGANGLGSGVRLGTQEFDCDVALAGRVYCNTIATTENIEPGDLLTTSSIPGFAMKVSNFENAQGAILGKAMERLKKGEKGQILVLVTLQ
nr:hypothetical protein [Bacteroidota bacterium]